MSGRDGIEMPVRDETPEGLDMPDLLRQILERINALEAASFRLGDLASTLGNV